MTAPGNRWVLARHRIRDDVLGVAILWAGFLLFVFALIFGVALFNEIQVSGWDIATQVPRWFAGALGVYATAVYLPLYVAHGYTRREAARQLAVATPVILGVMAGLVTLGYAVERAVYAVAGWPQELSQSHLFTSATQYHLAFVEFALLFAVWAAAGAMVGAGFYRHPGLGFATLLPGLALVGAAESVLSPGFFEVVTQLTEIVGVNADVSVTASAVVALVATAVALPVTWLLVRDLPLRPRRT